MRHALYMASTFEARYPRIAREGRELTLTIDRSDVLNSTVSNRENTIVQCFSLNMQAAALESVADDDITGRFNIKFNGEGGLDAGGLTQDWLSLFMQEALDP
jgi:hypothetical protein